MEEALEEKVRKFALQARLEASQEVIESGLYERLLSSVNGNGFLWRFTESFYVRAYTLKYIVGNTSYCHTDFAEAARQHIDLALEYFGNGNYAQVIEEVAILLERVKDFRPKIAENENYRIGMITFAATCYWVHKDCQRVRILTEQSPN